MSITDLDAIPFFRGEVWVEWKHRHNRTQGETEKVPLHAASVQFTREFHFMVRVFIEDETNLLQSQEVFFKVFHQVPNLTRENCIGTATLDLAEFARSGQVSQRCRLEKSSINCSIGLRVHVQRVAGDHFFGCPDRKAEGGRSSRSSSGTGLSRGWSPLAVATRMLSVLKKTRSRKSSNAAVTSQQTSTFTTGSTLDTYTKGSSSSPSYEPFSSVSNKGMKIHR